MAVDVPPSTARRVSAARGRILESADALFYAEGIRSVGVDRLISASSVTKATFYKHFGSKDALVLAYMQSRADEVRATLLSLRDGASTPDEALRRILEHSMALVSAPGFRGSPFMNAAVEFPDLAHPVRAVIATHRDWFSEFLSAILRDLGDPLPGDGADDLQLAWDGVMAGAYAGDPVAASASLARAVERVIEAATTRR